MAELRRLFLCPRGGQEEKREKPGCFAKAHARLFLFSKRIACPSMNSSPSATCAIPGSKLPSLIGTIGPGLLRPYKALSRAAGMVSAGHHTYITIAPASGPTTWA
jgi:hypothetical protein